MSTGGGLLGSFLSDYLLSLETFPRARATGLATKMGQRNGTPALSMGAVDPIAVNQENALLTDSASAPTMLMSRGNAGQLGVSQSEPHLFVRDWKVSCVPEVRTCTLLIAAIPPACCTEPTSLQHSDAADWYSW